MKGYQIFRSEMASWLPALWDPAALWPHCQNIFFPSIKNLKSLNKLLYILHEASGDIIRGCFKITLRIYADDRLCIGGAEMHPILIKFYFQTIFSICRMILVFSFYLIKYFIHVDPFFQF